MCVIVFVCLLCLDKVKDLIVFLPNQTCHCELSAAETDEYLNESLCD